MKLFVLCLLLFSTGLIASPPTPVQVDTVQRLQQTNETQPILAFMVSLNQGATSSRVNGVLQSWQVKVGQQVKKGEVLAQLSREVSRVQLQKQQHQVNELRAQVRGEKAAYELARRDWQRLERLRNSPAVSRADLDRAAQQMAVAQAAWQEADHSLQKARSDYQLLTLADSYHTIRAPFDAVVIERYPTVGEWVSQGSAVLDLLDVQRVEVNAALPVELANGLQIGDTLQAQTPDGQQWPVTVRAIVPTVSTTTRTQPVRLEGDFSQWPIRWLANNQRIQLNVPLGDKLNALTVAKDAILQQGSTRQVLVVIDGQAQLRQVELGQAVGNRFVVLGGLEAGDQVITRGNERLRPGQAVSVTNQKPS